MHKMNLTAIALTALLAAAACADTFTTDLGVTFDGVATETPDGNYKITAGDQTLIYRKEEIVHVEKNNRTGKLDMEEVAAQAKKADEDLTKKTGLTMSQRNRVDALLVDLMSDGPERLKARNSVIAMADECDVYKYLEFIYLEATPYLQAQLLDVLYKLDPTRAVARVRGSLTNLHPAVRAKAVEMLGQAGDTASAEEIARGLVDPDFSVRIAAAYALAALHVRAATPALIDCIPHPDLRVSGAAREALAQLWQDVVGDKHLTTVDDWKAVWTAHDKGVGSPITLTDLKPLADPAVPFVAG